MNSDRKKELVSIGDTTTDVFMELKDASLLRQPQKRGDELCLRFGDKIAVEKMKEIEGVGNAANVAVGASRLGVETALWTILGNDDDGERTKQLFVKEGLDTSYVQEDKKHRTNFSVVLNYKAERTILVYHAPRVYRLPAIKPAQWIYFTSMGKGWEKVVPEVLRYQKKNKAFLAFNPGTFQLRSDPQILKEIISCSELVFTNKEEAAKITKRPNDDTKSLLSALLNLGPKTVVITDGSNGAYAAVEKQKYFMPTIPAPVVERTGCGDSFAAGMLAAKIKGKELSEALVWGALNAASVIQYVGAQDGLLKEKNMADLIANNKVLPEAI